MSAPTVRLRAGAGGLQPLAWHRTSWAALGSTVTVQVYGTAGEARALTGELHGWLEAYEQQVSRFRADSDIARLNAAAGQPVELGPLARRVLEASLQVAAASGGLLDPLLGEQLEAVGYGASRAAGPELAWEAVWQQPQRLGQPREDQPWRQIRLNGARAQLPAGWRYDPGAVGKGLAADLLVDQFAERSRALLVDCGGDLRAQVADDLPPFPVALIDPRGEQPWQQVTLQSGAIATSALTRRLWPGPDGHPHHHLLDPRSGQPVWPGWAGVCAFAPTALEAETRAKIALLSASREPLLWGGACYPDDPAQPPQPLGGWA